MNFTDRHHKVRFYGVKIEAVYHTADTRPEARFRKVVWPGSWNKEITLPSGPLRGVEYEAFFRPLVAELERTGFAGQSPFKRWGHIGRFFRSRINPGISYGSAFAS